MLRERISLRCPRTGTDRRTDRAEFSGPVRSDVSVVGSGDERTHGFGSLQHLAMRTAHPRRRRGSQWLLPLFRILPTGRASPYRRLGWMDKDSATRPTRAVHRHSPARANPQVPVAGPPAQCDPSPPPVVRPIWMRPHRPAANFGAALLPLASYPLRGAATARKLGRHRTQLPPFGSFEKVEPPARCPAQGVAGDPRRSRSALAEGSAAIPTVHLRTYGQWIRRWISLWITLWITSRPCGAITGLGDTVDGLDRRPNSRCS